MKLITERTLIREVAKCWHGQYPNDGWHGCHDIYKRLDALNKETATVADVNAIIGVTGWADPGVCDECGQKVSALVSLGREVVCGDEANANLCRACLRGALAVLDATEAA